MHVSVQIELAALLGQSSIKEEKNEKVSVQIELAALLGFDEKDRSVEMYVSVQIELAALLGFDAGENQWHLVFPSRSNWLPC